MLSSRRRRPSSTPATSIPSSLTVSFGSLSLTADLTEDPSEHHRIAAVFGFEQFQCASNSGRRPRKLHRRFVVQPQPSTRITGGIPAEIGQLRNLEPAAEAQASQPPSLLPRTPSSPADQEEELTGPASPSSAPSSTSSEAQIRRGAPRRRRSTHTDAAASAPTLSSASIPSNTGASIASNTDIIHQHPPTTGTVILCFSAKSQCRIPLKLSGHARMIAGTTPVIAAGTSAIAADTALRAPPSTLDSPPDQAPRPRLRCPSPLAAELRRIRTGPSSIHSDLQPRAPAQVPPAAVVQLRNSRLSGFLHATASRRRRDQPPSASRLRRRFRSLSDPQCQSQPTNRADLRRAAQISASPAY